VCVERLSPSMLTRSFPSQLMHVPSSLGGLLKTGFGMLGLQARGSHFRSAGPRLTASRLSSPP